MRLSAFENHRVRRRRANVDRGRAIRRRSHTRMRRMQNVVHLGHHRDAFIFGQPGPRDVRVDNIHRPRMEQITKLKAVRVLLSAADRHIERAGQPCHAVDILGHQHVLPPAHIADRVDSSADLRGLVQRVGAERIDQHLPGAPQQFRHRLHPAQVAGSSPPLGKTHLQDGVSLADQPPRILLELRNGRSPHPLIGRNPVAKLAAQKLIDRHARGFAQYVPQRNVDTRHRALEEAAVVASQTLRRIHLFPQHLHIQRVFTQQNRRE